jgi:hypothetical protein
MSRFQNRFLNKRWLKSRSYVRGGPVIDIESLAKINSICRSFFYFLRLKTFHIIIIMVYSQLQVYLTADYTHNDQLAFNYFLIFCNL